MSTNEITATAIAAHTRGTSSTAAPNHVERDHYIPHPSLITMLRTFLRDRSATFKTREQAEALEVSLAGDCHLMLIGPTAMGKSLVYMLLAAQRNHKTTCVLLPLSALHLDFERRCRELKIESSQWLPRVNENPRTRIVYVSPEHAMTSTFIAYLRSLSFQGQLAQFVIDEVHLVHSHLKFRHCFSALKPLVISDELFFIYTNYAKSNIDTRFYRCSVPPFLCDVPSPPPQGGPKSPGGYTSSLHPCCHQSSGDFVQCRSS